MLANHVILYPLLSPIPSPPLQRYPPLLLPFSPTPLSPIFSPPLHSPPPPSFALSATRTKSRPVSAHPSKGLKHKERGREGEKEADARPCGALPHSLKTLAPVFKGPQTPRCSPRSLIPPARSLSFTHSLYLHFHFSLSSSLSVFILAFTLISCSLARSRALALARPLRICLCREEGIKAFKVRPASKSRGLTLTDGSSSGLAQACAQGRPIRKAGAEPTADQQGSGVTQTQNAVRLIPISDTEDRHSANVDAGGSEEDENVEEQDVLDGELSYSPTGSADSHGDSVAELFMTQRGDVGTQRGTFVGEKDHGLNAPALSASKAFPSRPISAINRPGSDAMGANAGRRGGERGSASSVLGVKKSAGITGLVGGRGRTDVDGRSEGRSEQSWEENAKWLLEV